MSMDFTEDEIVALHTALVQCQSNLSCLALKADQVATLLKKLRASAPNISFAATAGKPKSKDKVKAPAVPAVDWGTAKPKKKPKDEGRERRK